jgi:hypothetical protein
LEYDSKNSEERENTACKAMKANPDKLRKKYAHLDFKAAKSVSEIPALARLQAENFLPRKTRRTPKKTMKYFIPERKRPATFSRFSFFSVLSVVNPPPPPRHPCRTTL